MKKRLVVLAGLLVLIVILAGYGLVSRSEGPVASTATTAVVEKEAVSVTEAVTPLAEAPREEATSTAAAKVETGGDSKGESVTERRKLSSSAEIPPPQHELAAGEYHWNQLLQRDAIYPIYDPEFAPAEEAPYDDEELVIGVEINGEAKAYAIGPLNGREMVNDTVGGTPVLVTW